MECLFGQNKSAKNKPPKLGQSSGTSGHSSPGGQIGHHIGYSGQIMLSGSQISGPGFSGQIPSGQSGHQVGFSGQMLSGSQTSGPGFSGQFPPGQFMSFTHET